MRCSSCWLLVAFALSAPAAPPDRALTKDGKLAGPLVVRDVQGGVAGFTGREWSVDPSGTFTVTTILNGKPKAQAKGSLAQAELAALVKELARCDAAKELAPARPFQGANPRVVSVKVGGKQFTLRLPGGQELPVPGPGKPPATEAEWFGLLLRAVQKAL